MQKQQLKSTPVAQAFSSDEIEKFFRDSENVVIENRVVSDCGRFESHDCNGHHFEIDWDEIDSPGAKDESGIPHEQVMEEMRALCAKLKAEP
jgi:hypothetical protein